MSDDKQFKDCLDAFEPLAKTAQNILNEQADSKGPGGMSLRDWFAGQALAGELASQDERNDAHGGRGTGICTDEYMPQQAARCYRIADAMLAARKQEAAHDRG